MLESQAMQRNAESGRQKSAAEASLQESHGLGGTLQALLNPLKPPLSIPIANSRKSLLKNAANGSTAVVASEELKELGLAT